jgi:hypothetical protein
MYIVQLKQKDYPHRESFLEYFSEGFPTDTLRKDFAATFGQRKHAELVAAEVRRGYIYNAEVIETTDN